ncbi:MAG: ribosome-associated translation inhibitor RaiA [Verrucomicrobiota bacterium]
MEHLIPSFPVTVTARHMEKTEAIQRYVETKLSRIHLAYPRIIDAKAVVDHQDHHQGNSGNEVSIILHCTNQLVIQASSETKDLYEAIDLTLEKLERQMRKAKTRRLQQEGH